ncbi:MAG: ATP-binding protein [Sulfuricellaceae bacterium]|nr:ATP-binding protein [Sulfuricellaceae bacterium]
MSISPENVSKQELEQAFSLFNEVSAQLTVAYHELQARVESLTGELAVANGELRRQYLEKEALSQRLEGLLAALPAGVVAVDEAGDVGTVNAAAIHMFGEDVVGQRWREVMRRYLRQTTTPQEWELMGRDGAFSRLNVSVSQLDAQQGEIILLHDVTEAYRMEQDLQRHRRLSAMGEMAAGLAHQLRTPLSTAILYVGNLAREGLGEAERNRFSEKALARLRYLEQLIQDMLSFVKGQPGERERVEVASLLQELQLIMEPQMSRQRVAFNVSDSSGGSVIHVDRKALTGALVNLLENAMQATGESGKVSLHAEVLEGMLALSVQDDGCGFDVVQQERLFEPFYTTRGEGTGLGLAIVRNVAQAHGGSVTAKSSPGAGSEFAFRLPLEMDRGMD